MGDGSQKYLICQVLWLLGKGKGGTLGNVPLFLAPAKLLFQKVKIIPLWR